MQNTRKRKQQKSSETPTQTKSTKPFRKSADPYSTHSRPTPEECLAVRDSLLDLHGFPQEFAKYRDQRQNCSIQINCAAKSEPTDSGEESVLDGLIKTVLSQNTTEVNSQRAFANLKSVFPTWEDVLTAELKCIENAIRCGGLAPTKASCIKNILSCLLEKKGKLCLEYLRDLSVDEIKAELSNFKGIGPKTVSCVLLFQLQQDDFPVDTHVFEIAKAIGWVPEVADRNKTYLHLNQRIPNELKFDLNCLLFTHGKLCHRCTKKVGSQQRKDSYGGELKQLKKYECEFCLKEFLNPQALGGHQNAHRKERLRKRRMLLQQNLDNLIFYLDPPHNQSNLFYNSSVSCIDVPEFRLSQEFPITSNPLRSGKK